MHNPHHVRKLRRERGLSQTDLAEALGCTPSNISGLEKNPDRQIGAQLRLALATAFGCDPDEVQK